MENNNIGHKGIILGIFLLLILIVIMYAIKNFSYLLRDKEIHTKTLESKVDSTTAPRSEGITLPKITLLRKSGIPSIFYWNSPGLMPDEKANEGSSLTREWIVLNDASCPVQLTNSI